MSIPDYQNLTEKKKTDRKIMADALVRLCNHYEISCAVHENFLGNSRAIAVQIHGPRGLEATIDFDGDSIQPDTFVVSWHMAFGRSPNNHVISRKFCPEEQINRSHRRKATDVCQGFECLLDTLDLRLRCMARMEATEEADPRGTPIDLQSLPA